MSTEDVALLSRRLAALPGALLEAPAAAWTTRRATGASAVSSAKVQHRAAALQPASYDASARTVDVVFTTGAAVARSSYAEGDYSEVLLTGPSNVRLDRLNAGAPLLDSHQAGGLATLLGAVVPGSARMEAGQGVATVRLTDAARAADTVADIRDGVIRNVSVGYLTHAFTRTEAAGVVTLTATDWEPVEISAVAVPADAGAQFRALPTAALPGRGADDPGKLVRKLADLGLSRSTPLRAEPDRSRIAATASAMPSPTHLEPASLATVGRWAEAMRAAGTLGTTEAGRALARDLNMTMETR